MVLACCQHHDTKVAPWQGDDSHSEVFDLPQIEQSCEMIALTLSGPDTYYDFRGRHLGVHYLLAEQFARHLGVRLRVEVCRDTTEMLRRLSTGIDADLGIVPLHRDATEKDADSLSTGWVVGDNKPLLQSALQEWYEPKLLAANHPNRLEHH